MLVCGDLPPKGNASIDGLDSAMETHDAENTAVSRAAARSGRGPAKPTGVIRRWDTVQGKEISLTVEVSPEQMMVTVSPVLRKGRREERVTPAIYTVSLPSN